MAGMSTEKTEALVIRLADFSETSRVVTFFSRDWGKLSTVAKGGKRLKGPFEAALDLLTACRIVFIRKSSSSLDILTEAQLKTRFQPKGKDLNVLYSGYYVAELLAGLTEEYDPHPVLYDEALKTLERLSQGDNVNLSVLRFELVTLREIGQLPSFDLCVVCSQPVLREHPFAFCMIPSGLICRECQPQEEPSQNRIQAGTVTILQRLSAEGDTTIGRLGVSSQQFRESRQVVTAVVCHAMGRRPKMLRYLRF